MRLRVDKHMRNLGHEVFRGGAPRKLEASRLDGIKIRRGKLSALRRGALGRVGTLRRTGVMPSGAHGAGVSGATDHALMALTSLAGSLAGAKRKGPFTAWLMTQRGPFFDPI